MKKELFSNLGNADIDNPDQTNDSFLNPLKSLAVDS